VFEINRNFRNEGISTRHNPEFTMLEWYCAYEDWTYMMDSTERLIRAAAGGTQNIQYQGKSIDLGKPFARLPIPEAIRRQGIQGDLRDKAFLAGELTRRHVAFEKHLGWGALQLMLFEAVAEKHLIDPTFIVDFPAEVSPLARRRDSDPDLTDRFELFIDAKEIANGFSELNDPEDQAARFQEQARRKEAGGSDVLRRRLHPRARVRPAADRGRRIGHRQAGDAPDRQCKHSRCNFVPAHAAGVLETTGNKPLLRRSVGARTLASFH
jgi:lysyl-tRNA synthetase class 2